MSSENNKIQSPKLARGKDGQLISSEYDDIYYTGKDGLAETEYIFTQELPDFWKDKNEFVIAETGFGTGLNFLATWKLWLQCGKPCTLHFYSVEKFPIAKKDLIEISKDWLNLVEISKEFLEEYPDSFDTTKVHCSWLGGKIQLHLYLGDVKEMASDQNFLPDVDYWFLDGFAPEKNPDMWSENLFEMMGKYSKPGTGFSTFTAVGFIRRAIEDQGFSVRRESGFQGKRHMLRGVYTGEKPNREVESEEVELQNILPFQKRVLLYQKLPEGELSFKAVSNISNWYTRYEIDISPQEKVSCLEWSSVERELDLGFLSDEVQLLLDNKQDWKLLPQNQYYSVNVLRGNELEVFKNSDQWPRNVVSRKNNDFFHRVLNGVHCISIVFENANNFEIFKAELNVQLQGEFIVGDIHSVEHQSGVIELIVLLRKSAFKNVRDLIDCIQNIFIKS